MREIIPRLLWTGNAFDARDLKMVFDYRIEAIIDVALEEPPLLAPRELVYCRFPLLDGQGNPPALIEAAISTALILLKADVPTLLCCSGGMSRSPAIAAAVIALRDGLPPNEALKRIGAAGPHDVSPLFWKDVVGLAEILRR